MENKYQLGKEIVYEAGAYIREHLYDDLVIENKTSPTDLVTQLDQAVQDQMIEKILSVYPSDHILAEEGNIHHDIEQGCVWVIDPIDGTTNFIVQKSDFAVMLSYFENGSGKFAFIYDVMKDELYHGGGSFAVYKNQEALLPYQEKPLSASLIASNAGMFEMNEWGMADLVSHTLGVRIYGSAGISFSHVLSGKILLYASYIYPWDYAAAFILGESLGYCTMQMNGEDPDFQTRQPIMMVPVAAMQEIRTYLRMKKEV